MKKRICKTDFQLLIIVFKSLMHNRKMYAK